MSIRKSVEYARMTHYLATTVVEGYAGQTEKEKIAAWQYLIDNRMAAGLPSYVGYMADTLINSGLIEA